MINPTIRANRGSDVDFQIAWKYDDGDAADLVGWDLALMDVSPELVSHLSATISDPANGIITGKIDWDDSLVTRKNYFFRIQLSFDGDDESSTQLIQVRYG
jgi:hypothetical protein